jgi:hypothetical protein
MKKVLLLAVAVMIVFSVLPLSAGKAAAASLITYVDGRYVWGKGIVFVFKASGYRNRDVRDANMFAGSNYHDLYCTVDKEKENIVCVARGGLTQYAGQTGIIYLAGQVFYVTIPDKTIPKEAPVVEPPLLECQEPEVLGASVLFRDSFGNTFSEFVPGDTIAEVEARADMWVDGEFWVWHGPVNGLECGFPPQ